MEKSLEQRSIFEATSACRRRLTECVSNPSLMADEWPRKRLADFNLWAHDSGALAKQRASLDRRLAEKHMVREVILNLLNLLEGLLTRCLSQTSEFAAHQDERTDLSETFEDVEDIMAQLVRISAAIRGAGIRARFERADDSFNLDRHIELKEYLEFLVLVASLDQVQKEQGNIDIILSGEITDIAQRLVLANLIRRHRYLYARRRWTKQAAQPETPTKPWIVPVAATLPEQVQPPPMPTAIPGNEGSESKPRVSEPSIITSTVPTAIQGPIQIPEGRQSSITAASSTSSRVVYPKPPKVSQDAMFFRCPCCFQTLPVAFTQHFRWRKHLGGDIQPYTCILKDCPKPLQLYVTRKEWTRHMREEHEVTKYWLCSACLDPTRFDVESHFRTHLQTQHEDVVLEDQIPTFVSMSTYMSPPSFTCCPLCPPQQDGEEVDTDALLNHTAEHVHSFSLQSLPWPIPEEGEREYLGLGPENLLDHFDFFDVASGPDSADGSPSSNSQDSHRTDETSNSLDLAFRDENPDGKSQH
ncbi:hypothetical protein QBC43DRAFT_121465 [Cladorrhinum sp. PSN259]|nr:hypothetical protein QBC43DRAFT_121465 [Cladorrhinum sp. PSN259]